MTTDNSRDPGVKDTALQPSPILFTQASTTTPVITPANTGVSNAGGICEPNLIIPSLLRWGHI